MESRNEQGSLARRRKAMTFTGTMARSPYKARLVLLLFTVALLVRPVQALAEGSYSAAADFSIASNPNGAWTYGWSAIRGSAFNVMTHTTNVSGADIWFEPRGDPVVPGVFHNGTDHTVNPFGTHPLAPGQLALHPGPAGDNAIVRWTAPQSGTYSVAATFTGADTGGTTTDIAVFHNSTELFAALVMGYGATQYYSANLSVSAGDSVGFTVGHSGNGYSNDMTGLEALIAPAAPADTILPVVTGATDRAANEQGWYDAPVTIDWTSIDPEPSSGTPTDPANTVASAEGQNVIYTSDPSCDPAGNCATGSLGLSIDLSDPVVTCDGVPTFLLNQPGASVSATVTDAISGPEASSASASVDTSAPGTFIVSMTGSDLAGHSSTMDCAYTVGYAFQGFFSPLDNLPTVNKANAGRTIPVNWQITDYFGAGIADPSSFVSVTSGSVSCNGGDPLDTIEAYSGGSGLQYLGNGNWQFNWKTPKAYAGQCRAMSVNLADGTAGRIAEFQFK